MNKTILVLLAFFAAAVFPAPNSSQILIIANRSVKEVVVSKADVHDVFLGSSTNLTSGSSVVPVLQKNGSAHAEFLKEFIGRGEPAFQAKWRSLVFSGRSSLPLFLDSDEAEVAYVARTPGAIGYILKESRHEGVKVLAVK